MSARDFRFSWQFPSLNTTFSKPTTKKQCLLQCFVVKAVFQLLYCCCGGEKNLLLTPATVSLTNLSAYPNATTSIQGSHLIGLPVSFFYYWPIRMSCLLLLCTELTLLCTELPEDCIYLNRSELSHFFIYNIKRIINTMASIWRKNTLLYLSLDNICSSKLTDFFELRSRKTARFSERIWSNADK